jgi:hypothetical protein
MVSENLGKPEAGREPTEDAKKAAEMAAKAVDLERVAQHYEQLAELGAKVKDEGQVEPERGTS